MLDKMQLPQDTEKRGLEIYEQRILPLLEPTEKGKFVAIDISTAEYEIDGRDADAIASPASTMPGRLGLHCASRLSSPVSTPLATDETRSN